jgi:pilus assembly protein CpaF
MSVPVDVAMSVDHAAVLTIRDAVLSAFDKARTPEMSAADLRQLTQALIQTELVVQSRRRTDSGVRALTGDEEVSLARAVDNQINGVGRLQSLLDIPGVEDIYIRGAEPVVLRMADQRVLLSDPIADTAEELFSQVQFLAAYHGSRERAFSPANPSLEMGLPDGSRLAAVCDNSPWPIVTIRRHPFVDITLDDMVEMGSITASMRRFLGACVRARRTIVVSGMPAAGKTVMLRALTRELDDYVRFATLETEFELGLHTIPDRFPLLVPLECRPGSVETDASGRPIGEVTLSNLLVWVLRHSVTLAVCGEVRGPEAFAFLKLAGAGLPGSMCTLHANSAQDAMDRLVTAAMEGAPGMSPEYLTRLAAQGVNYVVHMEHLDHSDIGGDSARFCAQIGEIAGAPEGKVAMNMIYEPADLTGDTDPRGIRSSTVQDTKPFTRIGFDLRTIDGGDTWPDALALGRLG